jgi:hypothetical protein
VEQCFVNDASCGINSNQEYDYVLVSTELITKEQLAEMQKLQPRAKVRRSLVWVVTAADCPKFIYLVRTIDLVKTMEEFDITVGGSVSAT